MKTIKVIKTGATAVETRKQLRSGASKVEVESRPNVGPELVDLIVDFKHLIKHRKYIGNAEIAIKLNIFESQVKLLRKLTRYGHPETKKTKKTKKERFKRRTELQNVR